MYSRDFISLSKTVLADWKETRLLASKKPAAIMWTGYGESHMAENDRVLEELRASIPSPQGTQFSRHPLELEKGPQVPGRNGSWPALNAAGETLSQLSQPGLDPLWVDQVR